MAQWIQVSRKRRKILIFLKSADFTCIKSCLYSRATDFLIKLAASSPLTTKMKKAILFAILTLSINVFAQIKNPISNPIENRQERMVQKGLESFDCNPELNFAGAPNHKKNKLRDLIQIYDSIYGWRWDTLSAGWKHGYRYIDMVYDTKHNLTSNICQQFNNNSWINYYKNLNIYDASDNLINETAYLWIGSDWLYSYQNIYTYDDHNNKLSYISKQWNSGWVNVLKNNYTYDANDNKTNYIYASWNGNEWVNQWHFVYVYDASNNLTNTIKQIWDGTIWVNQKQTILTYSANNNLMSQLYQNWNGNIWVNFNQNTYTYDANNNQTSALDESWGGGVWVKSMLGTFTYNSNNNLTYELWQIWNGSAWLNASQGFTTYDAINNGTNRLMQKWYGNIWVNDFQRISTVDVNNFERGHSNKVWNITGTKLSGGDSTYNYFHTVVGITDLAVKRGSITVFPNPSSDKITIAKPNDGYLSILNLSGQQLLQQEITEPTTTVDVSGLKCGVYFVQIMGERMVWVGKFIKQ